VDTFSHVRLNSFDESAAREPDYAKRGRLNGRLARFDADRYPNLMRILRCQAMESECRE
jgi:hypothetical protein